MTRDQSIIELGVWLRSPAGRYLLEWEQDRLDHAVTDAFGFHALQLGMPEIQGLRANRMPHRWVACGSLVPPESIELPPPRDVLITTRPAPVSLYCEFDALPFPQHSVDLVVLPHALELAADPHQLLREVERILVPEGRVVISGLNPASLWALRQRAGNARRGIGLGRGRPTYLPRAGEFIGYWRLRDWLRLLGFHIESGRFGCYRPPLSSERWLQRFDWMDPVGDRWWPVLGAAYFLVAVKRVRGMRLVGLLKNERRRVKAATAAVANREPVEADI
ncbi:class I SAM-dependent methyltransferase [Rubrivivax gelatinosus]|uniref:Methyltransferase family protein n=1 Tax=Rubrivivax gelatinosus TaxID=28068 RepID=A0A4R2MFH6_RUBGE|nr:methyltransferase domain-containing protein [Rubrivivax gelatinosus]MBK1685971.1 SAM-dependent methyltransferase [Rubrivivax gelatinosus]TCP04005.1 methyltransferase family protein [Rubrivivax gelatinosus]